MSPPQYDYDKFTHAYKVDYFSTRVTAISRNKPLCTDCLKKDRKLKGSEVFLRCHTFLFFFNYRIYTNVMCTFFNQISPSKSGYALDSSTNLNLPSTNNIQLYCFLRNNVEGTLLHLLLAYYCVVLER